jgi:RNA polymerase sigma factor (sigma-70 family)
MRAMIETDDDLLLRAVEGDAGALRDLLKRCGPRARASIQGKIDARWRAVLDEDDVMQVAYMEAFLHLDQLTSRDIDGFTAWLARIAQNALRDALRGLQRAKRPNPVRRVHSTRNGVADPAVTGAALVEILGVTTTTPSRHAATSEAIRGIDGARGRLPPDYRTVVQLVDLHGLCVADAAASMGRSTGAAHMLRARAHDRLRVTLGRAFQSFSGPE